MSVHPLLSAILPHRIAGGIGLLLIGIVVASVHSPSARPVPFSTASVASGVTDSRPVPHRSFPGNGGGGSNEGDEAYRGFSLSAAKLPPFRVTDLSKSLRADEQFDLLALSQNSEVLGTVVPTHDYSIMPGTKRPAPRTYAARWKNGTLQRFPIPDGAHQVVAGDMNDRGDVGAISIRYRRGKPSFNRVILYPGDAAATYRDLGTLDPDYALPDTNDSRRMRGVSANLLCLNNRGTLIALVGNRSWFRRADGTKAPVGNGVAFDLNNNDTAVGFMSAYESGAAMWRNADDPAKSSVTPLLPVRAASRQAGQSYWRGSAECLNDNGDAVISVPIDSSNGFRRLGRSAFYLSRRGKLQFIAQMRGYQRTRVRINASRDVVGFVDTDQQTQTVSSLLYRDGKMYDLTDAARASGWKIVGAVDINNKRQILAYGIRESRSSTAVPILLTPIADGS